MPGHKLTPEIPNVWTHTSVPALITPPPPPLKGMLTHWYEL